MRTIALEEHAPAGRAPSRSPTAAAYSGTTSALSSNRLGREFLDNLPPRRPDKEKIAHGNAERVLKDVMISRRGIHG
jgi:hypothetical protein